MADKVDEAIAAAAAPAVKILGIPVQMSSSGRPAMLQIPDDCSDAELVDLAGWLLTVVRQHVAANRGSKSRIVIPNPNRNLES